MDFYYFYTDQTIFSIPNPTFTEIMFSLLHFQINIIYYF